ncbi:hypothetical protein J1N35_011733, partial [Gossypium stocksii]
LPFFFCDRSNHYSPVYRPIDSTINILLSSRTTREPKAILAGYVYYWPTNLAWVMGLVVLFICFLNGATLVLYHGSLLGCGFEKFIKGTGVTILGTVLSLVKTWKSLNCLEGLNWTEIKCFATTGEASNIDDDLWLSLKSYYKLVLECCGGTELLSVYIQRSLLQPQAFGTFSTAAMTVGFVILDEHGHPYPDDKTCVSEVRLLPLYLRATNRLLNVDPEEVYFEGMPMHNGMHLRRHGDILKRTFSGYLIVQGRADDTMNLGGIKTSFVEIERVYGGADESILETTAISVAPPGGGLE